MQYQGRLEMPGDLAGTGRTRAGSSSAKFSVKSDIALTSAVSYWGKNISAILTPTHPSEQGSTTPHKPWGDRGRAPALP